MNTNEISSLITTLGFPIVACVGLGVYIWWNEKKNTEAQEKRDEKMYEEIRYNREVNTELLTTNRLLANDIKGELKEIKYVVLGDNK